MVGANGWPESHARGEQAAAQCTSAACLSPSTESDRSHSTFTTHVTPWVAREGTGRARTETWIAVADTSALVVSRLTAGGLSPRIWDTNAGSRGGSFITSKTVSHGICPFTREGVMADWAARRVRGPNREVRCVAVEGPTVSHPVGPWVASCYARLLAKPASGSLWATALRGAPGPVDGAFA